MLLTLSLLAFGGFCWYHIWRADRRLNVKRREAVDAHLAIAGQILDSWDTLSLEERQAATERLDLCYFVDDLHETPGVGDTSCLYNALDPALRCALRPSGPCYECPDYAPRPKERGEEKIWTMEDLRLDDNARISQPIWLQISFLVAQMSSFIELGEFERGSKTPVF